MERRHFLRAMLGVAAATALPSEIWPFRKIFLPPAPKIIAPNAFTFAHDPGFAAGDTVVVGHSRGEGISFVIDRVDTRRCEIYFSVVKPPKEHQRDLDILDKLISESPVYLSRG